MATGILMTSMRPDEEALEKALAGISRVAQAVVALEAEDRARAMQAAERSYCQTARALGYSERQAQGWAAAVMEQMLALLRSSEDYRARAEQLRRLILTTSDPFAAARLRGLVDEYTALSERARNGLISGVCSGR
jgi:flagellar biosynthesis/type III secretory pathway protein FliH